jgi:uncharacterized coiled-coil protein SlyX
VSPGFVRCLLWAADRRRRIARRPRTPGSLARTYGVSFSELVRSPATEGCAVALQHNSDYVEETDFEVPLEPRRTVFRTIFWVVVMAVMGSASAFAWRAYGAHPSFAFLGSSPAAPAEPKIVGIDEFHAFQQQTAERLQSNAQDLGALQAEVKRLSDQLAAVSAQVGALQSAISSAPAAAPTPPKKPKPRPPTGISTGGAPLPPVEPTH